MPTGTSSAKIATYGYIGPMRAETRSYGNGGNGNGAFLTRSYDALRRATLR